MPLKKWIAAARRSSIAKSFTRKPRRDVFERELKNRGPAIMNLVQRTKMDNNKQINMLVRFDIRQPDAEGKQSMFIHISDPKGVRDEPDQIANENTLSIEIVFNEFEHGKGIEPEVVVRDFTGNDRVKVFDEPEVFADNRDVHKMQAALDTIVEKIPEFLRNSHVMNQHAAAENDEVKKQKEDNGHERPHM